MGFAAWWDDMVVSRIIRCGCATESIMQIRRDVVPLARGSVFELGCGGGINQQLYDPGLVSSFAGLDPGEKLLEHTRAEAAKKGWETDIRHGYGEAIPFDDGTFDTVVCTFTLCSVASHNQTLRELRRVLKPGGTFLYAEHGRSPDTGVALWQERIDPVWSKVFGNCHLSRPVTSAIEKAGFAATPMAQKYSAPGPRFAGWMEWGSAVKAD